MHPTVQLLTIITARLYSKTGLKFFPLPKFQRITKHPRFSYLIEIMDISNVPYLPFSTYGQMWYSAPNFRAPYLESRLYMKKWPVPSNSSLKGFINRLFRNVAHVAHLTIHMSGIVIQRLDLILVKSIESGLFSSYFTGTQKNLSLVQLAKLRTSNQ